MKRRKRREWAKRREEIIRRYVRDQEEEIVFKGRGESKAEKPEGVVNKPRMETVRNTPRLDLSSLLFGKGHSGSKYI